MFNIIFTVVIAIIITLLAGLGLLAGRKRMWCLSLVNLVATAGVAVGAFFLSKLISNPLGALVYDILMNYLPEEITVYANTIESSRQIFGALFAVLLAPILFLILFVIARSIIALIMICPKKLRAFKAKGPNPAGMICGFACGIVIFAVFSIPVSGLFTVANDVTVTLSGVFGDNPTYATVAEITDASVNNPISKTVNTLYGDKLFEKLTTTDMGEHELSLTKEIDLLITVGDAIISYKNGEATPQETAEDIREISPAFEATSLLPTVLPELFTTVNASWESGEDFHGIERIDAGPAQPVVDPLIDTLVSSDYDSIKKDASTIIEILAILMENDVIESAMSDPLSIMENEEMTASVIYNLLDNDHFTPVVEGAANLGISVLGEQLHFHAHKDALYNEFLSSANSTIPTAISEGADVAAALSDLFDDYGLDVSDDSVKAMAEKMTLSDPITVLTGEELTLNDGKKIVLNSADVIAENSILICTDQITVNVSDIDDKETESHAIAKAIREILSFTSNMSEGSITDASSIQKIGSFLDALSGTKIIGETSTEFIIVGLFQSDLVHDSMGLSLIDATDVAHTICNKSHTSGYAPILQSVADTVEVINLASSDNSNKEEFNEKVGVLISNLTPETSEVLQKIATKEAVEKQGVRKESSENVSNLISNVLGNLSSAKSEGMSDEQMKEMTRAFNLPR